MIDILLSTFNGEPYLAQQLDSILSQSHSSLRIMIRDDGSTDNTLAIVKSYANTDGRILLITDNAGNIGAAASFLSLIERSDAPYFMLADQDDIWHPEKISRSFEKISEMESEFGDQMPLLVFTDLRVVDQDLTTLDESFWHFQRLDPEICRNWKHLLAQNVVTGSTIIANAAARRCSLPFILDEMMHDHWIAVNVAKKGVVDHIGEQTVSYRQHTLNAEGARRAGSGYLASKAPTMAARMSFYRRAATHFGGVSASELAFLKIRLNLQRLVSRNKT